MRSDAFAPRKSKNILAASSIGFGQRLLTSAYQYFYFSVFTEHRYIAIMGFVRNLHEADISKKL